MISELRANLIALKAVMEKYKNHQFSIKAISVHNIVGNTEDESLQINSNHLAVIESEVYAFLYKEAPRSRRKARLTMRLLYFDIKCMKDF